MQFDALVPQLLGTSGIQIAGKHTIFQYEFSKFKCQLYTSMLDCL